MREDIEHQLLAGQVSLGDEVAAALGYHLLAAQAAAEAVHDQTPGLCRARAGQLLGRLARTGQGQLYHAPVTSARARSSPSGPACGRERSGPRRRASAALWTAPRRP